MRAILTACVVGLTGAVAHGQSVHDQIRGAWQARQDRVRTADFRVTCDSLSTKGCMSRSHPELAKSAGGPVPSEDVRATIREVFILDGARVRLESDGVQWSGSDFRNKQMITLLDGKTKRQLEVGGDPALWGKVYKDDDYFEAKGQSGRPFVRCFRALAPGFKSFHIDDLKPTGAKAVIGGRTCDQFVIVHSNSGRHEYWLDPKRDWVVTREVVLFGDRSRTQLDINYAPDAACGWVPKSWEFRHTLRDQSVFSTQRFTVNSYTINQPIPESQFELTFPSGTEVFDDSSGSLEIKTVPKGETYRTPADPTSGQGWWRVGLWAIPGVLLVAMVLVLARRRVVRRRPPLAI